MQITAVGFLAVKVCSVRDPVIAHSELLQNARTAYLGKLHRGVRRVVKVCDGPVAPFP